MAPSRGRGALRARRTQPSRIVAHARTDEGGVLAVRRPKSGGRTPARRPAAATAAGGIYEMGSGTGTVSPSVTDFRRDVTWQSRAGGARPPDAGRKPARPGGAGFGTNPAHAARGRV